MTTTTKHTDATETKHTPGPWQIDQYGHVYGGTASIDCPEAFKGAKRLPPIASIGKDAKPLDWALLAAAPDLLDALELAARLIKTARQYFPKSIQNGDRFDLENAAATVGKALDKAKGGTR